MSRIANRVPAAIRLPARKAPCQIPEPVQLLIIQPSIVACRAIFVRAFPSKVIRVAEFHVSKPGEDRFHGPDGRIDPLRVYVAEDDGPWPAHLRSVPDVAEYTLERALL